MSFNESVESLNEAQIIAIEFEWVLLKSYRVLRQSYVEWGSNIDQINVLELQQSERVSTNQIEFE